eukprot:COSAG02_NODE_316_length_24889_cov_9.418556_5_plen_472_part_00
MFLFAAAVVLVNVGSPGADSGSSLHVRHLQLELEQLRRENSQLRQDNERLSNEQQRQPPSVHVPLEELKGSKPNLLIVFGGAQHAMRGGNCTRTVYDHYVWKQLFRMRSASGARVGQLGRLLTSSDRSCSDDVGYGDPNCFGHPTARTPNLDRMAAEGAKLVQYLSAANICSPSRGSLMTGRLYGRLGIWPGTFSPSAVGGLQKNETTLATALRGVGYTSGMVGKVRCTVGQPAGYPRACVVQMPTGNDLCSRSVYGFAQWHLGQRQFLPVEHGFDFYFGVPMTQNTCVSNIDSPGSVLPGNSTANPYGSHVGPCPVLRDATVEEQSDLLHHKLLDVMDIDDRYDAAAESFIRNASAHRRPWFFYFSSHHTHAPQFAPPELTGYTPRGLMGDSLSVLDRSVGRLFNLTANLEIDSRTLTVFSGTHHHPRHSTVYLGLTVVPPVPNSADNGGARYWGPDIGGTQSLCNIAMR